MIFSLFATSFSSEMNMEVGVILYQLKANFDNVATTLFTPPM